MLHALAVLPSGYIAAQINEAHRAVKAHAKGMLAEAQRAGALLLEVKKREPHGTFKTWVEANCDPSYSQAARYMKVAKNLGNKTFDADGSIEAFLGYDK